jgi:hypothetical protein
LVSTSLLFIDIDIIRSNVSIARTLSATAS